MIPPSCCGWEGSAAPAAPQDRKGSHHWGGGSLAPREGQAGPGLQEGKQPWLLGSGRKDVLLTRKEVIFLAEEGKS